MLKIENSHNLSCAGLHWFEDEDILLLEELNQNIDIKIIARNHKRTLGSINSRRRLIAYKMYLKNISIEEIIEKTKLDEKTIKKRIENSNNYKTQKIIESKIIISLETQISEMKNDINNLKNTIKMIEHKI